MKRTKAILLCATFLALLAPHFETADQVVADDYGLQGPILTTQVGARITFQDVGTGRVWGLETATPLYTLGSYTIDGWSPDGCQLLVAVYSVERPRWFTLSITTLIIDALPPIGGPIWSPDGRSVTFASDPDSDGRTFVYNMDLRGREPHVLLTTEAPIRIVRWLSEDELLYIQDGYRITWNQITGQSGRFGTALYPRDARPSDLSPLLYSESLSPTQDILARFYDLDEYTSAHDPRYSDATDEVLAELDAIPQLPGFDLYFLNEGTMRHVDIGGQFLESLVWSPSGRQIAVSTHNSSTGEAAGIYAYDLINGTLQRVGDVYRDERYHAYIPGWSPDEAWLAFNTPAGYVIQRLSDGERIGLDGQMNGSQLWWSPMMDYSETSCPSLES